MQSISTTVPRSTSAVRRKASRFRPQRAITITLFLLPAAIIYIMLVILPVVQAAYFGFYKWNGLGPATNFVGFENYIRILSDDIFLGAISHNLLLIGLSLITQLPLALFCALLVGRRLRGRTIFRMGYFLPFVLSEVVTGLIWSFIYHPRAGLLNWVLSVIVPSWDPPSWLGTPNSLVLGAIFAALGITTGLAALLGPLLSTRIGKIRTIVITQLLSIPFLIVLGFVPILGIAVGAALVRGALFNMGSPLYDAFAMERTAERARPIVIGVINGAYTVGYLVAPLISTRVQERFGFAPLFLATATFYALAAVANYWLFMRKAAPARHSTTERAAGEWS